MGEGISLKALEEEIKRKQSTFSGRLNLFFRRTKYIVKDMLYNFRKIKWFFQRGKRGWADCDVWGMDSYLVSIIIPMLKKLKETNHGYPYNLTEEKWDALLEEMIECFEAADRVIEDEYFKTVSPEFPEKKASKEEISQWLKMSKEDQKVFEKKSKIFIKYFFSLWD